jgi:predicted metalloprotease with PDZ domain
MKMKSLFAVLLILAASCSTKPHNSKAEIKYLLSYDTNRIHVKLSYIPVENDSTKFTYGEPMFGGQPDIVRGITAIKVSKGNKLHFNELSREITVSFGSSRPITIEYDIIDTHTTEHGLRGELFRPMIGADYFYCHGINLFLNPAFRDSTVKAAQTVSWERLPYFRLFQSFDPENDGTGISHGEPGEFLYKLITGAPDIITEKTKIDGTINYLVLRINKERDYNTKALTEYFEKYYSGIRRFWNDTTHQSYSLIIQPFLSIDHNIGGMSLGNGFAGKYSFKIDTVLSPERILVLSHEIGHHWIGGKIDTDIKDQWFGEGFNDYLTYYTVAMTGLMTPGQFLHGFNSILESHYSSKINSLPNDSVWKNYWKMGDYNKLPYRRGEIFAFYLDNQIRIMSKGRQTFHDLMLSLKEFCNKKNKGYQLSIKDFNEVASGYVGKETIQSEVDKYIVMGEPIRFTKEMLIDEFSLSFKGSVPVLGITDEKNFTATFR